MAWFLALQGPSQPSHQASVYELQDLTDVDQLAQELVSAVTLDRVVAIPAMIFYRFFRAKVESLVVDMEQQAIKLVEIVHGDRK